EGDCEMDETLKRAYKLVSDSNPSPEMLDWEIAAFVLERFNVPRLGEDLAKECIFRIVNHISYPDQETTNRIVARAEGFAGELWDDLGDEPHMADLERKEYQKYYGSQSDSTSLK